MDHPLDVAFTHSSRVRVHSGALAGAQVGVWHWVEGHLGGAERRNLASTIVRSSSLARWSGVECEYTQRRGDGATTPLLLCICLTRSLCLSVPSQLLE